MALTEEALLKFVQANWKESKYFILNKSGYENRSREEIESDEFGQLSWNSPSLRSFCIEYFASLAHKHGMPSRVLHPKGLPWSFRSEYNLPDSLITPEDHFTKLYNTAFKCGYCNFNPNKLAARVLLPDLGGFRIAIENSRPQDSLNTEQGNQSDSSTDRAKKRDLPAKHSLPRSPFTGSTQDNEKTQRHPKLNGEALLKHCLELFERSLPETSICIRAGYKTDSIGVFRRAFARSASVSFGPLSRMIGEYKKQNRQDLKLIVDREFVSNTSSYRPRNSDFRFSCLSLHGAECAVCGMKVPELIEAAHIVPVAFDGVDHPGNGIPLCPTHHSAFDRYLFTFDPAEQSVIFKDGFNSSSLGITKTKLLACVSTEALKIRHNLFNEHNGGKIN